MASQKNRREILKGGLALAGLSVIGIPEWALPALAQGETIVQFSDQPANTNFSPAVDRRTTDLRKIDGPFTPKDQFFTTQHYGHPDVDPVAFRLKISGLVDRPKALSLDDLKKMTMTVIDGDFPREVVGAQNLIFGEYKMPARRNTSEFYDAKDKKPAGKREGTLKLGTLAPAAGHVGGIRLGFVMLGAVIGVAATIMLLRRQVRSTA